MPDFRDLLKTTKAEIREVDTAEADEPAQPPAPWCSTSASPTSTSRAPSPASVHIPRGQLESNIESRIPDKATPVVVHCASGVRSAFAAKTLGELGYTDVVVGGRRLQQVEGRGPRAGARPAASPPSSATATSATCCSPRSARRAS